MTKALNLIESRKSTVWNSTATVWEDVANAGLTALVEVLSPATAGHDHILKRVVYERAGVREYWLVHPVDRIVTIYCLQDGRFGVPEVREFTGRQAVGVLPQVQIDWDPIAALTAQ